MELIRLENAWCRYPRSKKDVLQGVSFLVAQGDFITLLGPNGAGKSTLFRAIYGTVPLLTGRVLYLDREIPDLHPAFWMRNGVHYMPQGGSLFQDLTIGQNLALAGKFLNPDAIKQGARRLYEFLEGVPDGRQVIDHWNERAGLLSGGQRQLVALGMVLLGEPCLLLLDEPTAGLTEHLSSKVLTWLKERTDAQGLSVVIVEHNLRNAINISNRILYMDCGCISEMDREEFADIEVLRKRIFSRGQN